MTIPKALIEEATQWRRTFHESPEFGYYELETSDHAVRLLETFGIDVHRGLGGTGVVGTVRNGDGPTIGIRADMDALPIQELGEASHKSTCNGCMHACGHDWHTAILLETAKHYVDTRSNNGTVHFIFQPAEEGLAGPRKMLDDGL